MAASLILVMAGALGAPLAGLPPLARRTAAAERLAAALAVLAAALGLAGALLAALGHGGSAATRWSIPGSSLALGLDGLSAVFLLPVFLVPALAQVYGLGYQRPGSTPGPRVLIGVLTAGMALLVLARNGALFLVGWEAMALSAFLLIATEHRQAPARQAAWVYLVATHLGTACLIAAFALLAAPDGSLDWSPGVFAALPAARAPCVFALALLGFGLKAGLMPLHFWLPAAHANAPSHVSAILSGVMIKTGVYGIVRVLDLLGPLPPACGVLLMVLGAVSALSGVAATLGQSDLKRLLAYSSIENVGIIGLGVGLAALGRSLGHAELVVLGLGGALLHVLNHSLFKPLLFFGAGSAIHATGTREMDALGGLLARMPRTGLGFFCGAAAICGLPLLNGFVSELALYLGLVRAATAGAAWVALLGTAALAALALVGGLVLATFVRCSATVFLGRARSPAAAAAHESPATMTAPMLVLAALCVIAGLAPPLLAALVEPALAQTFALPSAAARPALAALVPFDLVALVVLGCAAALALVSPWLRRRRQPSAAARPGTWDCGYADASSPRLQYTAASFAQLSAQMLRWASGSRAAMPPALEAFPSPHVFTQSSVEPLLHGMLWPSCRNLAARCSRLRFLQRGKLQIYLLYILVVLLLLLSWAALENGFRA